MQWLKRIAREWVMLSAALIGAAFTIGDGASWIEFIFGHKPAQEWVYSGVFILFATVVIIRLVKLQSTIDRIRGGIVFNAAPGSLLINHPLKDESPLADDEVSIYTTVHFEIWTDIDIDTASLVLNIVGIRNLSWWKFPGRKRLLGIRIEGQDNAIYRKKIKHSDKQPFRDKVTFKWRGKKNIVSWGDIFLLELVLKVGIPNTTWRVYIDPKLYERGLTTPL